jgi:hypothetical protein
VVPSSSNNDRKLSSLRSPQISAGGRLVKQAFARCSSEVPSVASYEVVLPVDIGLDRGAGEYLSGVAKFVG